MSTSLPIDSVLDELRQALTHHRNVVLQAPPGAGKSTRVPIALLDQPWLARNRIVMLEPRRLAARAVATRMADTLGEAVGRSVGYRTRLESRVSNATRIEVVTEGILTRWLQNDATLESIGLLIFDEYHERSLHADLGLALSLDSQENLRDDLRILVMSATLDGAAVAKLLGDAPVVTALGRSYEVATKYRVRATERRTALPETERDLPRIVASTIVNALHDEPGDVLVFLPGQGEIRRTQRLLEDGSLPRDVRLLPLYGELPIEQQDAALRPAPDGQRKIVLATNIAETSLTIEGIRIIVDAGLVRRARFDPGTGMSRLQTLRISRASAEQRRGRAGRLQTGVCYRLWSETDHAGLEAQTPAEIVDADLAPLALELAAWGVTDPLSLRWLDPPPLAAFNQARELLQSLNALEANGRITAHGRTMSELSTHPRLAHMMVRGAELGLAMLAAQIAAVLGERDLLRVNGSGPNNRDIDLRLRIEALNSPRSLPKDIAIDPGVRQRVLHAVEMLSRQLRAKTNGPHDDHDVGRLLALAYPDRIAQSRGGNGRYLLSGGRGAQIVGVHSLNQEEFLVIADIDAGEREAVVRLATPVQRRALEQDFTATIETRERIEWSSRDQAVIAQRERWLGALKLEERRLEQPDAGRMIAAMLDGVREIGIQQLPWSKEARALQSRIVFAAAYDKRETWPAVTDAELEGTLDEWLSPWLASVSRRDHLGRLDMHAILLGLLHWNQQQRLNEFAPTHLAVPSGSHIPIDYSGTAPKVSVRLQEVFGLRDSPSIADRSVPLTLELLSPAHRPVQVTKDLMSFWARGYVEVKKELKGRYPKHYWPDDPLTAEPTARARRRGS
ncbi:MAG: ATP-dependent helicase HrpB [Steroidobacteraceae bacterium]